MATTISAYNNITNMLGQGLLDLDTDTFKLALVTSSYTFSAAHDEWADASANEVAAGSGYTTGGETLSTPTFTQVSGTQYKWDAVDVTWSSLTKTFRAGILYASGTFGAFTNPLIAYILYDDTPADVTVTGVDFVNVWHATGIMTVG